MASIQQAASKVEVASAGKHSKLNWFHLTEKIAPYLFIGPTLIGLVIFVFWPLVYSFYLSFFDWNFISPNKIWVGLDNYLNLINDRHFHRALQGTLFYMVTLIPLQVFLPLGIALLLWPIRKSRLQTPARTILFSPTIIAYSVAAIMWLWIFNANQGVLNKVIIALGGERIRWLSDSDYAIWVIIVVATWKTFGFNLLLYIAALEAVPKDYLEAAELDGANSWELMKSIRFPLITPTFFFVVITTVISVNDDVFGAINVMTDGGPRGSTSNIIYYLYEAGFRNFQIGTGSAVAVVVFIATVILTWIQFRFIEGRVHYE